MEHSEPGLPGESMAGWDALAAGSTAADPDSRAVSRPVTTRLESSLAFRDPMGYSGAVQGQDGMTTHAEHGTTMHR